MAKTKIADVIVPEVFADYVINRTLELSALVRSGIARTDGRLNEFVGQGGKLINMPFWKPIGGVDQVMSDSTPLTVDNITADKEVAALLIRGQAWSANELSGALAGSDPMAAIGTQVAEWWVAREQAVMISILNALFGASGALTATHSLDISAGTGAAAVISANAVLDAKQLLGDAAEQLTAMIMHSAVYTVLQKQNLIQFIPNSRGEIEFASFLGKRVIVDDGMPNSGGVYNTYLFAAGAFSRGEGVPTTLTPVEMDRDSLASDDILINRRAYVLHPNGFKFTNTTVTGATPSNTELALPANWVKVVENKRVGIALLKHKIA